MKKIIYVLIFAFLMVFSSAYIEKKEYVLGETVKILVNDTDAKVSIISLKTNEVYKFLGGVSNEIKFTPKHTGEYILNVESTQVQASRFKVIEKILPGLPNIIITDKLVYGLGEEVKIRIDSKYQNRTLIISSEDYKYNYFPPLKEIIFLPKKAGNFEIVVQDEKILGRHSFAVLPATQPNIDSQIADLLDETKEIKLEAEDSIKENLVLDSENIENEKWKYYDRFKTAKLEKQNLVVKNSKNQEISSKIRFLSKVTNESFEIGETIYQGSYDVEIIPDKIAEKLVLFGVDFKGNLDIGLDEVEKTIRIDNEKSIDSFAFNPKTDFDKGIITKKAIGTQLWKCRDWDFETQSCSGQWEKLRKLNPGEEYDIFVDANDPGYAETGVATVNSVKPVYLPGDKAELIMVVLDNSGYPVSGADVTLKVTSPLGIETIISGISITETAKGVYEAAFIDTWETGDYILEVRAIGRNVDSMLESSFSVKEDYPFDIIRETPSVINPYKPPFTSSIRIISRVPGVTEFNFTEVLPRSFGIESDAIAFSNIDENIHLKWFNVKNNSVLTYSFSTPVESPNVYSIGESYVDYGERYTEARQWFLAIDPPPRNGIFTYRDTGATSTIKYRLWYSANTSYGTEQSGPNVGSAIFNQKIRCTKENNLCIWVGVEDDNGVDFILYNVTTNTWGTVTNVGGQGKDDHFPIDVECEDLSGNCLIVYESTTGADDIIYYRIFYARNASFSNEFTYTSTPLDSNDLDYVKLYPRYNSNYIGVAMQSDGEAQVAAIWNGTAFRDSQLLFDPSGTANSQSSGCAWEGSSGDFVCFYGRNANGLWAYTYNSGTWTNNGNVVSAAALGNLANIVYACGESSFTGDLTHDKLIVLIGDSGGDRYGSYWNGTALNNVTLPTQDGTSEIAVMDNGVCQWEHDGGTAVFAWVDDGALVPEWGTFTESSNTFSNSDWATGSTTGMSQWNDDVEALILSIHPYTDEMVLAGTSLASLGTSSSFNASRWTGSTFSNTGLGGIEEVVSTTTTGNQEFMQMGSFDWIRYDDIKSPNISLVKPIDEHISKNTSFNFNWTVTDNKDRTLLCNITINNRINSSLISSSNRMATNLTIINFQPGEYNWNVTCWDDFWNQNTSRTNTFVVAGIPQITINSVGGDTTSVYTFINQTPKVNATIHLTSRCYLSEYNESYLSMVTNGRVDCGTYTRNVKKACVYTNNLTAGNGTDYLFMACNSTYGDYSLVPKQMQLTVECDSHTDCPATKYCSQATKQCVNDVLTGFSCQSVGIGSVPNNAVCRSGSSGSNPNALCVNDSSYSYTGWYCTADSDDCVYNNNGNSYDLNYSLCDGSNDYRSCGVNNTWRSLVDCAAINDGANQTATNHSFGYCGYYASAQTCNSGDMDLGNYGCQGNATDCGSYIYAGAGACGSVLADCDLGCGASCDQTNSTTANISGGTCYYNKACSNLCAWSQSTETAPSFCINDFDGGLCNLTSRTNPSSQDICYFTPGCFDSIGANMTEQNVLRQNYCDTCDAIGGALGQFAPAPNSSCTSNCSNTGTIYYDSGLTPNNRSDDCSAGISDILSDTLTNGDIWNSTAAAYCNNAECDLDCGTLYGECNLGVCGCVDNDYPIITLQNPANNSWTNNPLVKFYYNVTDISVGINNCSLYLNNTLSQTNSSIIESYTVQTFSQTLSNGTYLWNIACFDDSGNSNTTGIRRIRIDTTLPQLSSPRASGTSFSVNGVICLNVTASDTFSGISSVYSNIRRPSAGSVNITLSDSVTTSCDQANGNGIYSVLYTLEYSGTYNWTTAYAVDSASNLNSLASGIAWSVSQGGIMNISMYRPNISIVINESDDTIYGYKQNCTITCGSPEMDCAGVRLFADYKYDTQFTPINTTTQNLTNAENSYLCGNISSLGSRFSTKTKAESHEQIMTTNTLGYVLRQSYNRTKAFITTQSQHRAVASNSMNAKHAIVNLSACTNDICTNVSIRRYASTLNAYTGFSIIQSDIIDVYPISLDWGIATTLATKDISGWSKKPSALSTMQNKCFIQGSGNFRMSSTDVDCNAATKVMYYFSDANTVTARRGFGEDCTDADGQSIAYVVCFNDESRVYSVNRSEIDLQTTITNYSIGATIAPSRSFITCGWKINDGAAANDADGIQANNMFYRINSSGQIAVSRSQLAATEATLDFYCYIAQFDSTMSFNAAVDQDTFSRTASAEIGNGLIIEHNLSSAIRLNSTIPICSFGFDSGDTTEHERGEWSYYLNDSNTIRLRRGRTGNTNPSHAIACQAITFPNQTIRWGTKNSTNTCSHIFNISTDADSGQNIYPIECKATSSNSASVFSRNLNVTINDHPHANILYPTEGAWITGNYKLNATGSYDINGTIANYLFEIDDSSGFTSSVQICSTSNKNCTFNTAQGECTEGEQCYLLLTALDNYGLTSSKNLSFWIDNNPPTVEFLDPLNFTNISSDIYTLSASASDDGIGVDTAYFQYRKNSTDAWKFACLSRDSPYECNFNTTNLTDGGSYQLRVYANDTLGHISAYNIVSNITILKTGPTIMLKTPLNNTYTRLANYSFFFNVSSRFADVYSCIINLNGTNNESLYQPSEIKTNNITVYNLQEKKYAWYLTCIDSLSNINVSETRNLRIDRTGPITIIDRPTTNENISSTTYYVNATVTDAGIGGNRTLFEYRKTNQGIWNYICITNITNSRAICPWNTAGLEDDFNYELRARSNDTLGNNGTYDINTNITVDNNGPTISLISPNDGSTDGDGTIFFQFSVNDMIAGIKNCSLIINNTVNQTITNVPENQVITFNVTNLNSSIYFWNVTCFDNYVVRHANTSETRQFTVDIRYEMDVEVASDKTVYQVGNQKAEFAEISNNVTDFYNQSIDATITTDFIIGNTTEPWWNISWKKRKQIILEEFTGTAKNNETVLVNLSGLDGYIDDCRKLRIVDTNTSREVPFNVSAGDNSGYCTVKFPAFVSAYTNSSRYFAYFNNSIASPYSYTWKPTEKYLLNLMLESFEDGNVWPPAAAGCSAGTPAAGNECSDGDGNFSNCDDNTDDYLFVCSSNGARYGTYTFILADWDTFSYTRGLWYNVNPLTACRGPCEDINVRFYAAPVSIDSAAEYCVVWANDQDTSGQELYRCNGATAGLGDNSCESTADPPAIGDYDLESYNLSSYGTLEMTTTTEIHMGGRGTATNDYCYYDDFKISGITSYTTDIRSRTKSTETFKARNIGNTVFGNYDFSYYMNLTVANYSLVSKATKTRYYDAKDSYLTEIVNDFTLPNVTLNSPLNGTTSNSSVTFTYRVNDSLSTINNCSLYIDGIYQSADTIIEEGIVQFFFPRIPSGGSHLWNVSCIDYYENTGWSQAWTVIIIPPDLFVNSTKINFNAVPIEGMNITLNATIENIGGSDATNISVRFYKGDPDLGGVLIENFQVNLSERTGNKSRITLNTTWIVEGPGRFLFVVHADAPLSTNGSVMEIYENNNEGNKTLNVAGWHYYYGNSSGNIKLESGSNASNFLWNATTGNIYIVETGTSPGWQDLKAIGRDINDIAMFNDFNNTDLALNMTGYIDSVNKTFTYNNQPKETMTFTIYQNIINYVPVINSTNSSNFKTGILWDSSDSGLTYYNGSQDLVFISRIENNRQGKYGVYDYELRIPAALDTYKMDAQSVTFYTEII